MNLRKLCNRKGAAIELAIATLLVVFGLCMILVTVTELVAYNAKLSITASTTRKNMAYIAEDFVAAHRTNSSFDAQRYTDGNYTPVEYTLEDTGGWLLLLYEGNMGIVKMGVEIAPVAEDCRILRWTYADEVVKAVYTLDNETRIACHSAEGA